MQAATSVAKEMEGEKERGGGSSIKEKEEETCPPPNDGDPHQPSLIPESQVCTCTIDNCQIIHILHYYMTVCTIASG